MDTAEERSLAQVLSKRDERRIVLTAFQETTQEMHQVLTDLSQGRVPDRFRSEIPADAECDPDLSSILVGFCDYNADSIGVLIEMSRFIERNQKSISVEGILTFCDDYQTLANLVRWVLHDRFSGRI